MTNTQSIDALFLTLTVLPNLSNDELQQVSELALQVDWENVVSMALTHGVLAIHCSFLVNSSIINIPNDIIEAAHYFLNEHKQQTSNHLAQLSALISKLNKHEIKAIPFKGPTLSYLAYNDFSLRTFRDLDFLIDPKDREEAISILNSMGYQHNQKLTVHQQRAYYLYGGQDILFAENKVPIEPHWELAPSTYALTIDYPALRKRAELNCFENHQFLRFNNEDYFLILCIHGSKEKWKKLKWIADIAWYIDKTPELNWQVIQDRAKQQGITNLVSLSLLITTKVFNTKLTESARKLVTKDKTLIKIVEGLSTELFNNSNKGKSIYLIDYYHWVIKDNLKDRLNYLLLTIFTPRVKHFQTINIPQRFFIFYYPYKLLHDYCLTPLWICFKWSQNKLRIR